MTNEKTIAESSLVNVIGWRDAKMVGSQLPGWMGPDGLWRCLEYKKPSKESEYSTQNTT